MRGRILSEWQVSGIRRAIFCSLVLAIRPVLAADTFEPLIVRDAQTQQGLTEFRSSDGLLDVRMAAEEDTGDVNGPTMPLNPALHITPDDEGGGGAQITYPRLAFRCTDGVHEVTSFGGPLLRVRPGDVVHIQFTNDLVTQRTNLHFHGLEVSPHGETPDGTFGDFTRRPYVLSVAPDNARTYQFTIPYTQPPGPYWYHAHVHGVAEEQVACGLSGALYVEGTIPAYTRALTRRFAPLLANPVSSNSALARQTLSEVTTTLPQLPHALLVLKDFWTPGLGPINGPLEQSINGEVTYSTAVDNGLNGTPYVMQYGPTEQIWEISNQSANLHYVLGFSGTNSGNLCFYVLGRDGIPDSSNLQDLIPQSTLFIPPAGRATVIVPTDSLNGGTAYVVAKTVYTVGDYYFQIGRGYGQRPTPWALIKLVPGSPLTGGATWPAIAGQINQLLALAPVSSARETTALSSKGIDATYVFAEQPNPVTGRMPPEPAQFSLYRLADSHGTYTKGRADAYEDYEPPIAQLTPGQPQRWIIQNTSTEWHAFHLHQCHFYVDRFTLIQDFVNPLANQEAPAENEGNPFYTVNDPPPAGSGLAVGQPYYSGEVDTVTIPGGMQAWLTLPLNEGPQIQGEFLMHCHILEHEDGGMMANVVAGPHDPAVEEASANSPHLAPAEISAVRLKQPVPLKDSSGRDVTSDVFRQNEFSLVTFGYTTCQGACPLTVEKCVSALGKLKPAETGRISPFFVSLDVERDDPAKLRAYAKEHALSPVWTELLDTKLAAAHAFGARRLLSRRRNGTIFLTHSTTIYLIDRSMKIRAAFGDEDTAEKMSARIEKELQSAVTAPAVTVKG
jgi:FtsP/CotA-like multicopper oxidase with cupredoxin domain/cytochrome oxidase Cu insertion factor (SCO1/SenC/PrrC family)